MIEFKQRVARKATPLLIAPWCILVFLLCTAQATVIKELRTGDNQGFIRLVLEFDRPLASLPSCSVDGKTLTIMLAGIANLPAAPAVNNGITQIEVYRQSEKAYIKTVFPFAPADVKTFALTGPYRFIVDAYRQAPSLTASSPAKDDALGPARYRAPVEPEAYHESNASPFAFPPKRDAHAASTPDSRSKLGRAALEVEQYNRFQQRLVTALIVVTSIIAVLLFLLIRSDRVRSDPKQRYRAESLPPTKDPDIEAIDTAVRNHLCTYDRLQRQRTVEPDDSTPT